MTCLLTDCAIVIQSKLRGCTVKCLVLNQNGHPSTVQAMDCPIHQPDFKKVNFGQLLGRRTTVGLFERVRRLFRFNILCSLFFWQVLRTLEYDDMVKESFQIQVDIQTPKVLSDYVEELLQVDSEFGPMTEDEYWAQVKFSMQLYKSSI